VPILNLIVAGSLALASQDAELKVRLQHQAVISMRTIATCYQREQITPDQPVSEEARQRVLRCAARHPRDYLIVFMLGMRRDEMLPGKCQ